MEVDRATCAQNAVCLVWLSHSSGRECAVLAGSVLVVLIFQGLPGRFVLVLAHKNNV